MTNLRLFTALIVLTLFIFSINFSATASATVVERGQRILILPFEDTAGEPEAVERVWTEVVRAFRQNGFQVAKITYVKAYLSERGVIPGMPVSQQHISGMARLFGCETYVAGRISEWRSAKKLKATALLSGGAILYGTVGLESRIINLAEGSIVWSNEVSITRKKQVFGTVQRHRRVLQDALVASVKGLFETFFSGN
ncbi:MAG: hypothetical protein CVV64_12645 [Candidatus Wallbacteria bacterium HGW-Wallbacteria-1]|jgi:TolB-like protein|uniref:FlgO domain-containing protein n=1 Tax=Candidatus Wallbacteria bacterium HGW-Wallbacteria-1 TaxID=2013854 RepID=A0A2N1PN74_9BACT|nr:MAG: hypothetical protein CVV64_12645 [Candidatus Wallbacteria bacterium HGW-Wallbacteria-1]